jgi:hypothetical protein
MNPFSLGLVTGERFCNRVAEIEQLSGNMRSGIHTVVYAPRRYGKSSLARVVMDRLEGEMVGIYVDLSAAASPGVVAEKLYRRIVEALGRNAAGNNSVVSRILSVFRNLRLSMGFNPGTASPEYSISLGDVPPEIHIEEVIGSLDEYCAKHDIKVCLVLDEFQEICELQESRQIEALLRGGMQSARRVSFLMLGSRRTLLRDMFEDRKRPFYKSAFVLPLPVISEADFVPFIVNAYRGQGVALSEEEAREIVRFCDSYPYYIQKLSLIYFDLKKKGVGLPEAAAHLIAMESPDFENMVLTLSPNQKMLLQAVAKARPANLYSQAFLKEQGLGSLGGVQSAAAKLKALDYIELRNEHWMVVDPIFGKWLIA